MKAPANPSDWDFMTCTAHANFAKALDYDAADEEKFDAIAAQHWATADKGKQREMSSKRLEMRTFLGTTLMREVNLRPMN